MEDPQLVSILAKMTTSCASHPVVLAPEFFFPTALSDKPKAHIVSEAIQ